MGRAMDTRRGIADPNTGVTGVTESATYRRDRLHQPIRAVMIAIVNEGPTSKAEQEDLGGERWYRLTIQGHEHGTLIARFRHRRSDGLATCLEKAAAAARMAEAENLDRLAAMVGEWQI